MEMITFIPITLVGRNLGERHRYLNSLVAEAHRQRIPFETIRDVPEQSPVDRLFKIELASRHRDVDYIIRNLKDEDMLYVSKALKSPWLLDTPYSDIINPIYLEDVLYPEMLTTAVNKMRHWIHLHLRDEQRCQEFYIYYKEKDFKIAMQFFKHCTNEFILDEVLNILDKLTPQRLKLLSEKNPQIAKLYFDNLKNNLGALTCYKNNEKQYFIKLSCVLKLNGDVYLDIIEQYFNENTFSRLSFAATIYIMKHKRNRVINKPELYTAWFLNIPAMAKTLSCEEIKDLIFKLARAEYLNNWFSYKNVEPLFKRLSSEERASLKKQVFVDKSIGDVVVEWPYPPPHPPILKQTLKHIFMDEEHQPFEYDCRVGCTKTRKRMIRKRKGKCEEINIQTKSLLDQLFDQYRFVSFERSLYELRKRMATESNPQIREYMMLVLVSKTGGRAEAVEALMHLLVERHSSEPCNLRAAIVRSLVRRAAAWRMPPTVWKLLLKFSYGLGLDGCTAEAACCEGLHAVVLRALLDEHERTLESGMLTAYFKKFSPLTEYALDARERRLIGTRLPILLLEAARNAVEPAAAAKWFTRVLDTLDAYGLRADQCPDAVPALVELAHRDAIVAAALLRRLYDKRVARRQLIRENFVLIRTDASYVNVLRHDAALLTERFDLFEKLITHDELRHERFLRNIALYFGESDGLSAQHLAAVERGLAVLDRKTQLARPLVLLVGGRLAERIHAIDAEINPEWRRLAAALRAHMHAARPPLDLTALGWHVAGAKAVANRVLVSSDCTAPDHILSLLSWRRWIRLALTLAERCGKETFAYAAAVTLRPGVTLAAALRYLRRRAITANPGVWCAVRPLLAAGDLPPRFDLTHHTRERLWRMLVDTRCIPQHIKIDYCTVVYKALKKISSSKAMPLLCTLETHLPELDDEVVIDIINDFMNQVLTSENVKNSDYYFNKSACLYMRIIAKYLLLNRCEQILDNKLETVGKQLFSQIEDIWNISQTSEKNTLSKYIDDFLYALQYNRMFLDVTYVSCIPVLERVTTYLQRIYPIEKWFSKYVYIHLTMLYFKAVRQVINHKPELFVDEERKLKEGVEIVGIVFGKYIAHEINELIENYFPTIREIYETELLEYFRKYYPFGNSRNTLMISVTRGLLEEIQCKGAVHVAEYIFIEELKHSLTLNSDNGDILKNIMDIENTEMLFFLYADLYSD